ncbi:hypothetical protein PybrP1_004928 [[Pythium] brassicae (nom. inval.)]|nr:hypothetical protein PybrP1_004928 [[Pythium] brassicae (nom. inval.)]
MRRVVSTIRWHATRSRNPEAVPVHLRCVASRLGQWALGTILVGHDLFLVRSKGSSCAKGAGKGGDEWRWHASMCGEVAGCDDLMWTCDCHFFSKYELPCMHLMLVARKGHEFDQLPVTTVFGRWCMNSACQVQSAIERCIELWQAHAERSSKHKDTSNPRATSNPSRCTNLGGCCNPRRHNGRGGHAALVPSTGQTESHRHRSLEAQGAGEPSHPVFQRVVHVRECGVPASTGQDGKSLIGGVLQPAETVGVCPTSRTWEGIADDGTAQAELSDDDDSTSDVILDAVDAIESLGMFGARLGMEESGATDHDHAEGDSAGADAECGSVGAGQIQLALVATAHKPAAPTTVAFEVDTNAAPTTAPRTEVDADAAPTTEAKNNVDVLMLPPRKQTRHMRQASVVLTCGALVCASDAVL